MKNWYIHQDCLRLTWHDITSHVLKSNTLSLECIDTVIIKSNAALNVEYPSITKKAPNVKQKKKVKKKL